MKVLALTVLMVTILADMAQAGMEQIPAPQTAGISGNPTGTLLEVCQSITNVQSIKNCSNCYVLTPGGSLVATEGYLYLLPLGCATDTCGAVRLRNYTPDPSNDMTSVAFEWYDCDSNAWEIVTGMGDNLGNHTATEDIDMSGNNITDIGIIFGHPQTSITNSIDVESGFMEGDWVFRSGSTTSAMIRTQGLLVGVPITNAAPDTGYLYGGTGQLQRLIVRDLIVDTNSLYLGSNHVTAAGGRVSVNGSNLLIPSDITNTWRKILDAQIDADWAWAGNDTNIPLVLAETDVYGGWDTNTFIYTRNAASAGKVWFVELNVAGQSSTPNLHTWFGIATNYPSESVCVNYASMPYSDDGIWKLDTMLLADEVPTLAAMVDGNGNGINLDPDEPATPLAPATGSTRLRIWER